MTDEIMEFDVLIVGAGPAGLSAAIRLAQLNQQNKTDLSICVLEKAASIGAHSISGAVFDPHALNELIPDAISKKAPLTTQVTDDQFYFLTEKKAQLLPIPPALHNEGSYIISLGLLCQWLGQEAETLGVNIFPGFAGSEMLYNNSDEVIGVATNDMGLNKNSKPTDRYQAGIQIHAKQTLLAEGARGSLTKQLIKKYQLDANAEPQTYGIGLKELWKIPSAQHHNGRVIHTQGWPLDQDTYGGGFAYQFDKEYVALGLIVGLDYRNPYLDPFQEMQRFKTHPLIRPLLENGECVGYGARALNEGGWQCLPKMTMPGAMLIGCAAGTLNVAKLKGNHTAMKSGMIAAESVHAMLSQSTSESKSKSESASTSLEQRFKKSWLSDELYRARNVRPAFQNGLFIGLAHAALDQWILRGKAPWTWHFHSTDHKSLDPASQHTPIDYPKPDGKLTFSKLNQLAHCNIQHRDDQPCHLKLNEPRRAIDHNLAKYQSPETRYCPAGVYEIIKGEHENRLQINAQNCIHCKTCDIKDPLQNITWTPPEGGSGPNYTEM